MKSLRCYAVVAIVLFAVAGMTVVLSHSHWGSSVIDSGSEKIYCHYLKNPLSRNAIVVLIPPVLFLIVALSVFAFADRGIPYSAGFSSLPHYSSPLIAGFFLRAPPLQE